MQNSYTLAGRGIQYTIFSDTSNFSRTSSHILYDICILKYFKIYVFSCITTK